MQYNIINLISIKLTDKHGYLYVNTTIIATNFYNFNSVKTKTKDLKISGNYYREKLKIHPISKRKISIYKTRKNCLIHLS